MRYPLISEYIEAIKSPENNFKELTYLRPVLGDDGLPLMTSGNFAVVFKMIDERSGKFYAVKCFIKEQEGRNEAYREIAKELKDISSPYLAPIKYLEKELYVYTKQTSHKNFPILLMAWEEGQPLDKYIIKNINNSRLLRVIFQNFKKLSIWLLSQSFAHGDLKPNNILVKGNGSLVLIDYDGMYVPAMKGQKARELGSPDFRHPLRTKMDFDKSIDIFPIVSILLSLGMIAEKSEYLEKYGAEDRLLLSYKDYLNLRSCSVFNEAITSFAKDIPDLATLLESMVSGENINNDNIKTILLTGNWPKRLVTNSKFERILYCLVGVYSLLVLMLPLYLRARYSWHIIMLFITTWILNILMFFVLVFIDIYRPDKREHINILSSEWFKGHLAFCSYIPLLLMVDSITDWFNGILPFMSQTYYNGEWYITALMWILWWYSNTVIINLPQNMLKWRLKYFKTSAGTRVENIKKELSDIRNKTKKGEKLVEEHNNKYFKFHKKDKPSFEKRKDDIEHIEMPNMAKDSMFFDNIQTGYKDQRWIEKSNSIKARDNYTCQLCHAFNPMQEGLVFIQQGEYETYHHYTADSSRYEIHVREFDFTININFYAGYHLAMPRLNVHHKIYYKNRKLWDYPDDCLVTLCEDCHHYVHSLNDIGIPIVEENLDGQTILIGKTTPKPYLTKIDHTDLGRFKPFSLVKENIGGTGLKGRDAVDYELAKRENKKWYDYQEILDDHVLHIGYYKSYDSRWNKYTQAEIKKVADFIIHDFIENILGFSKIKQ